MNLAVIGDPKVGQQKKRIVLKSDFADQIAKAETTLSDFARDAEVGRSTLYALMNPSTHKERKGGMYRNTAWAMARAYARAWNAVADKNQTEKVTAEEAFSRLFDEVIED